MNKPEHELPHENTSQELQKAHQKIEELQQQVDRFTYIASDFENFRRRVDKERSQWAEMAYMKLLGDLLVLLDDFERAFVALETTTELHAYTEGFKIIYNALKKILDTYGVKEIDFIPDFDPAIHEAIARIKNPEAHSGAILEIVKKGYFYKNKLLRPATVVVAE